jgi:hypothetical protein
MKQASAFVSPSGMVSNVNFLLTNVKCLIVMEMVNV